MRNKLLPFIILLCFITYSSFSQTQKISFEVAGMCGMCQDRIENALDIKGVKTAYWSAETQICKITYNSSKITEKEIHQAIAKVGHDTPMAQATEKAYEALHHCCRYDRLDYSK